jgi:hypothetical protein
MLKYYTHDNGFITSEISSYEDGCLPLPAGFVDEDKIESNAYEVLEDGSVKLSDKYLSLRNLNSTDWKMVRHRDQLASGIATSLTDEEYQTLLTSRQSWREKASE